MAENKKRSQKCLLVGLGGSGGKVITKLYERLIRERGENFDSDVTCVAIDTDQDELNKLAQLGVKKVPIGGSGTVGDMFNLLGGDVDEWCPNTRTEGNFFDSVVYNGASQCRLKSRLCFANFLKDDNNALVQVLEEFLTVSATSETVEEAPPMVYIVSSIAGGTGSGIFVQTALYIKKFFRKYNMKPLVYGLFACPDLYKEKVGDEMPNLYANAYAVVRELNAFNMICGDETNAAYGGKLDLDIEISTQCEGRLFEKNSRGRYGDKPYDVLYFVDRVNSMSKILGGLEKYYEEMANIAYSHLYVVELAGKVASGTSNQMHNQSLAPLAIYGSAGAASMVYPCDAIYSYIASKAIAQSVSSEWTELDRSWANYLAAKTADAKATGRTSYTPALNERAERFLEDFKKLSDNQRVNAGKLAFLAPMVQRGDSSSAEALIATIESVAQEEIKADKRFGEARSECGIAKPGDTKAAIINTINQASGDEDADNLFSVIRDIDAKLAEYCKKGLRYANDMSISFANRIYCDDKNLLGTYDKDKCSVVNGLLINGLTGDWVHPIAARYSLYEFSILLDAKVKELFGSIDTPNDDQEDFYNYLVDERVKSQKNALNPDDDDEGQAMSNAAILKYVYGRMFGKRKAKLGVEQYFEQLDATLKGIEECFANALLYFSISRVRNRIKALIGEYEFFFDNIDQFLKMAEGAVATGETKHDNGKGAVYICASAEAKQGMYENVRGGINLQDGPTIGSIGKSLFTAMREKSALKASGKSVSHQNELKGISGFFSIVSDMVKAEITKNPHIQPQVEMNVFEAIKKEYELTYPDAVDDIAQYSDNPGAKIRVDQFVAEKMAALTKMAAPYLMYDVEDHYSGMFDPEDSKAVQKAKRNMAKSYRFLAHCDEVTDAIVNMTGTDGSVSNAVDEFYSSISTALSKSKEGQTIPLSYVNSDTVDRYTILCYSTVDCLQPYQIHAFDELKGGVYYKHYAKRIEDMQEVKRYSLTPHLDKRWHKHGTMPYINVAKEMDCRYDLAKAFLFALCYGFIGFVQDGSDTRLVFQGENGREAMIYNGRFIPVNKLNRAMYWMADKEALVEKFAYLFDKEIDKEIEKLSKYTDTVGSYKTAINNYARILNQMKRNIFRNLDAKKTTKKEADSVLTFAWKLHLAEENEQDKDYAELLVQTLCQIVKKYAKAPYNREDIEDRVEGSMAYENYMDVGSHVISSFLEDFAASVGKKLKVEKDPEAAEERRRKNSFGRDDSDLVFETGNLSVKNADEETLQKNASYDWVRSLLDNAFKI